MFSYKFNGFTRIQPWNHRFFVEHFASQNFSGPHLRLPTSISLLLGSHSSQRWTRHCDHTDLFWRPEIFWTHKGPQKGYAMRMLEVFCGPKSQPFYQIMILLKLTAMQSLKIGCLVQMVRLRFFAGQRLLLRGEWGYTTAKPRQAVNLTMERAWSKKNILENIGNTVP